MLISTGDTLLSGFFILGLFQFFWLSVMLVRKGLNPSLIRLCLTILFSIWLLIWPAYDDAQVILLSLTLFLLPILFSFQLHKPFARHLRLCWHTEAKQQPTPWLMLLLSLLICAELFVQAPALGLGVALSLCMAWSAADLCDKSKRGVLLGLKGKPQQTLAGHLVLVLGSSLLCAWSLQLYHGLAWQQYVIATLIAGLVASGIRALWV